MHVYVLTNNVNGKRYVGQTIRPLARRLVEHQRASAGGYIAKSIRKHGWGAFSVASCELGTIAELNEFEEFAVKELRSHISQHGYNAKRGGNNHFGQPITEEARRRISKALTGRPCPEKTRRKISEAQKGIPKPPERVRKQAESLRGRKMPERERQKIIKALTGRPCSPQTRARISAALKGRKCSPEHTEKNRQKSLGKKHSAETKRKMSVSRTGKKYPNRKSYTPEQKAAHSERMRQWWADRKRSM